MAQESVQRWVVTKAIGSNGPKYLGSIKGGEFLDQLSDYQLLKKDSAPSCDLCLITFILITPKTHKKIFWGNGGCVGILREEDQKVASR
jgi:hypothetical protein